MTTSTCNPPTSVSNPPGIPLKPSSSGRWVGVGKGAGGVKRDPAGDVGVIDGVDVEVGDGLGVEVGTLVDVAVGSGVSVGASVSVG